MTVRVTKDKINVREKLSELDKPTGQAGLEMLRAETPQEQFNLIGAGRRRMNPNGDMRVAQRGTSVSLSAADAFLVDRWRLNNNVGGTVTYSRHASDHPEFPHSIKVLTTTADTSISAGNYCLLSQDFEGQDVQHLRWGTASAKPLTVSFWVKSSEPTMYTLEIQTAGSIEMAREVHINSANTWEYKTVHFPPNTVSTAIPNTNALGFGLIFWLTAGSTFSGGATLNQAWSNGNNNLRAVGTGNVQSANNKYFEVTGLQVEAGNIATPFEHRSYGEELALCQRYYTEIKQFVFNANKGTDSHWDGHGNAGSYPFPVTMRASPSVTIVQTFGWLANTNGWTTPSAGRHPVGVGITNEQNVGFTAINYWDVSGISGSSAGSTTAVRIEKATVDAEL